MSEARMWRTALLPLLVLSLIACTRDEKASGPAFAMVGQETTPGSQSTQPKGRQSNGQQANSRFYRMKMVQVMDQDGFDRPIPSGSMLIPADWQHQGATRWNINDGCNTIQTTFSASGSDGRGFEVFPEYVWVWADDPSALRADYALKAQMGTRACEVMPPVSAADYFRRSLARSRPDAEVVSIEPMPKLMQALQQEAQQTERMASQYGMQARVRGDVARLRLRYNLNGRPVEEWIIVRIVNLGTLGPSINMQTGAFGQAYSYRISATAIAERAPQGQLDASEELFGLLLSSIRINPEWQRRVTAHAQTMQQIELGGVRARSAIVARTAEEIRSMQSESYQNQQNTYDRIYAQYSETVRGVESYRHPTTGETVELSNQFGNAWVNNRGEYLLSDQAGFDPNVTFREEWKRMEPVRP